MKIEIYKTILSVVLYGCETWSFALKDEYRLRVFEDSILRRIFGPKRDKNGEDLCSFYRSPNISRMIKSIGLRWAGRVARMEEARSAFKILTGKPTGNRPLGMNHKHISIRGIGFIRFRRGIIRGARANGAFILQVT